HYWDVFNHSVETVATAEFLLRESKWKYGEDDLLTVTPWSEEISRHFDEEVSSGSNRRLLLKLGALMHDIAKPATKTVEETGRTRFLGHAKQGAATAVGVLERLRFSSREIRLVENLVYHHLRPAQMANDGLPTSRAVYRYFRDTEGAGIDVLFLALADYLATNGPRLDIEEWQQHNQLIGYILTEHLKQEAEVLPVKLIDGHDLMDIFGLSPGRLIGELLTEVREAQVAGELSTREEAIELVRKELEKRQCGMAC
ncbi:MAG: HD domain-containing protein, partial [Chloroflexi bacterium]|nr:HD domain-containing protein [Chloroflexota bacterium]